MFKVPFPHVLEIRGAKDAKIKELRVVTDQDIEVSQLLLDKNQTIQKADGSLSANYHVYQILELYEKRKAKGNWEAWPVHPTYYDVKVKYLGIMSQEEAFEFSTNS